MAVVEKALDLIPHKLLVPLIATDESIGKYFGRGMETEFLTGKAADLNLGSYYTITGLSPQVFFENVIYANWIHPNGKEISTERIGQLSEKYWRGDERKKAMLHRFVATLPPVTADSTSLTSYRIDPDSELTRDMNIRILMSKMFTIEDNFSELKFWYNRLQWNPNDTNSVSATRRIVSAVRSQIERESVESNYKNGKKKANSNKWFITLNKFIRDEKLGLSAGIQKEIGETMLMIYEDHLLDTRGLWAALLSNKEEMKTRATEELKFRFVQQNRDTSKIIAVKIESTPIEYTFINTWQGLNKVIYDLDKEGNISPEAEIISALCRKIKGNKDMDMITLSCFGEICGALDGMLSSPKYAGRREEFVSKKDAQEVLQKILDLYLHHPVFGMIESRQKMLNLAETLAYMIRGHLPYSDLKDKIGEIYMQPLSIFYKEQDVGDKTGGMRIPEREAARNLTDIAFPGDRLRRILL